VGWAGLMAYCNEFADDCKTDQLCVSLETAHPAKFPQEIEKLLGFDPAIPPSLEGLEEKQESFDHLENNYEAFKRYLITNYG
jgi:threonine synthase